MTRPGRGSRVNVPEKRDAATPPTAMAVRNSAQAGAGGLASGTHPWQTEHTVEPDDEGERVDQVAAADTQPTHDQPTHHQPPQRGADQQGALEGDTSQRQSGGQLVLGQKVRDEGARGRAPDSAEAGMHDHQPQNPGGREVSEEALKCEKERTRGMPAGCDQAEPAAVHAVLLVICQTWNITATSVIWLPNPDRAWLIHNRRNGGDDRSGVTSSSVFLSPIRGLLPASRRSGRGSSCARGPDRCRRRPGRADRGSRPRSRLWRPRWPATPLPDGRRCRGPCR